MAVGAVLVLALGAGNLQAVSYQVIDLTPGTGSSAYLLATHGTQQFGSYNIAPGINCLHACVWSGAPDSLVDLHPEGLYSSEIMGVSGTQMVGWGNATTANYGHAYLWDAATGSTVDLNPVGFTNSVAHGTDGFQQVGQGIDSSVALLWTGTAASVVNLQPAGCIQSAANGVSGGQQVGVGVLPTGKIHAFLWSGTAESAVDLNPRGHARSWAGGICGGQQVGKVDDHATLWTGTAASAIDLNPYGAQYSVAQATNGTQQVGIANVYYNLSSANHAYVWDGTAAGGVDLHLLLPAGFAYSEARSIDAQGNIVGIAEDASGRTHAILWQAIPEPATLSLLALGVPAVWRKRRGG